MTDNKSFEDVDVPEDPLEDLDRATQQLTARTEERRYGKKMVIVEGFEGDTDLESLASELKSALGTGGTVKGDHIELQGDHEERVRELLKENGYTVKG
ncbi:translation initiation factor [Haloplanus halobius]|uniref:translation initiation factor n=1 Tax=Haloplanus halobius TaxID=2934938 RepID=UPI00200E2E8D|nr:translation initiation factor [Haloplanus sp. XH21]